MAVNNRGNIGKITQIIGAVLDIKFSEGQLPEINEAITVSYTHLDVYKRQALKGIRAKGVIN